VVRNQCDRWYQEEIIEFEKYLVACFIAVAPGFSSKERVAAKILPMSFSKELERQYSQTRQGQLGEPKLRASRSELKMTLPILLLQVLFTERRQACVHVEGRLETTPI
jgi:hypothetical protein